MNKTSMQQRLLLIYAATLVGTLVISWWIATTLLSASLERRLDDQLIAATQELAQGGIPFSLALLERLGRLVEAEIILIGPDQQIAMATAGYSSQLSEKVLSAWNDAAASMELTDVSVDDVPYRFVLSSIEGGADQRYVAVAVAASLDDVRGAAKRAAVWLAAVALIGIVLLGWVGQKIGRKLTVPVQQLAHMAGEIAAGDRTVRAPPGQPNELGALADALDTMTEKLGMYEDEIATRSRLATLGELSARVAHEIRNPLTAIKMQIQLMAEEENGHADRKLDTIIKEIDRLELIVSSTLAVGRKQLLHLRTGNVNKLVREVLELVEPQLEHRRISVVTRLGTVPDLPIDGDKIKQILFNLVDNSVKAMPDGGQLQIVTDLDEDQSTLIIHVEDSGSGIDPGEQSALFARPITADEKSLRLGLVLCREFVELHRGTISADSSPALNGARVSVRIPVTQQSGKESV